MSPATLRHGAVILAAGGSHRLGVSKQLSRVGAEPLVRRAARAALATHPVRTVVAVGADADATFAAVADLDVERVEVTEWAQGMGASLRAAVQACDGHCDGLLVLLCDQPALTAAHLQRLLAAWRDAPTRRSPAPMRELWEYLPYYRAPGLRSSRTCRATGGHASCCEAGPTR